MALGGFDELVTAGASALGYPDPYGTADRGVAGSSIEIAQVEGDPSRRTVVVLRGRSMPYQGSASWGVAQRTVLTRYPGNPVATQQVLGSEAEPTTINGTWKNRFIRGTITVNGREDLIRSASDAVKLFSDLARAGKQVRVHWETHIRTGLIKRFTPTPTRTQDIPWEIEFEWSSMNDETAPRASVGALDAGQANDLWSYLNRAEDIAALAPLAADVAAGYVAQVVNTVARVRDVVSNLVQVLRLAETAVNLPATLLGSAQSSIEMLGGEVGDLLQRIGGPRSSAVGTSEATQLHGDTTLPQYSRQGSALSSSSDTQVLKFEIWRRSLATASAALLFASQQQVAALLRRAQPQTAQIITVREGQDLYGISLQFYGAPDFANFLAQTNRLTTVRVPPGTQLRIPPRPNGASADVAMVHAPRGSCDARCSC